MARETWRNPESMKHPKPHTFQTAYAAANKEPPRRVRVTVLLNRLRGGKPECRLVHWCRRLLNRLRGGKPEGAVFGDIGKLLNRLCGGKRTSHLQSA